MRRLIATELSVSDGLTFDRSWCQEPIEAEAQAIYIRTKE